MSPILFITRSLYAADALLPELEKSQLSLKTVNKRKALAHILPAIAAILILSKNTPFDGFNLQICWLFSQIGIYIILHSWTSGSEPGNQDEFGQILRVAVEISPRIIAITGSLSLIWWQGITFAPIVGLAIVLKSVRWISLLILVCSNFPPC
jgi:hypothetical protein